MKINLSAAGKRFNREWIFRNANLEFLSSQSYAITGPNGSGKSTLLQTLGGMLQLSEGSIAYYNGQQQVKAEEAYRHISFCAPYLELLEEMTLIEFFHFHFQFKETLPGIDYHKMAEQIDLKMAANKQIRYYSSGMKQRVKLAQAIFTNTAIVLLDEPCSNLDIKGIELYHSLVKNYCSDRLLIVCSNDEIEYSFCKQRISIMDLKHPSSVRA